MEEFIIDKKIIRIFENVNSIDKAPVIYINTVMNEGEKLFKECLNVGCSNLIFVEIANISWNNDLTPWYMGPISKGDRPCMGYADKHLDFIVHTLMNVINEKYKDRIMYNIIAGYSLAGLFAFYSLYETDVFSKAVCVSSSFWYKDFVSFVKDNEMRRKPDSVYFSLGDKESKTNNEFLKVVENNTLLIRAHCEKLGINNIFELNKGGHFTEGNFRMAKGIKWILEN